MRKSFNWLNFIKHIVTKNWYVILIIAIAAFLRLYKLEEFITFLGDQGRDAIIIKDIATLKHLPALGAPSSLGGIFLGPFYYYFVAPFLLLTWFNPVGLAFAVAFWTIIGMAFIYWILRREVNESTAIGFLLFTTFTYTLIELSRFSWNPNLLPVFASVTVYFFYKLLKERKIIYAIAFGTFYCLSFQLHHLAALIGIGPILVGLYALIKDTKKFELIKLYVISIAAFIFFYAPLILFDIKNRFLNTTNLIKFFTEKKEGVETPQFADAFTGTVDAFFNHILPLHIHSRISLLLFFIVLALCIVLYKKIAKNTLISLYILQFFTFLVIFSRVNTERHPHYFGSIFFSFFIIIAYFISTLPKKIIQYVGIGIVTLIIFAANVGQYKYFFMEGNRQIRYAQRIANSFEGKVSGKTIQLTTIPGTESDYPARYFLQLKGHNVLPIESVEIPEELFVLCYELTCEIIGNDQWHISMFGPAKIVQEWKAENVTIYKLVHNTTENTEPVQTN